MSCQEHITLSRRRLLVGGATLAMWGMMPRSGLAATGRDPRLLTIILRGGLDGLSMVAPVGDAPNGMSVGAMVPLIMRGKEPVMSMSTRAYNTPLRAATSARLMDLYTHTDPLLARLLKESMETDRITGAEAVVGKPGSPRPFANFIEAAETTARLMTAAGGPHIGALSYDGWDTHANEGAVKGALANNLTGLDQAIKALHDGLGPVWKETCAVIVTEFGRTARINGSDGTDHGTATCAVVIGGAVKGGRVLADWPGLTEAALYEKRDLKPTKDLRSIFKGVLQDHLGMPAGLVASRIFPDSQPAPAIDGLIA